MDGYDFSFSGLKTAVLRLAQREAGVSLDFPSTKLPDKLSEAQKANIAASVQRVAIQTIINKAKKAFEEFNPASVALTVAIGNCLWIYFVSYVLLPRRHRHRSVSPLRPAIDERDALARIFQRSSRCRETPRLASALFWSGTTLRSIWAF
jgi:hypothetical protein